MGPRGRSRCSLQRALGSYAWRLQRRTEMGTPSWRACRAPCPRPHPERALGCPQAAWPPGLRPQMA